MKIRLAIAIIALVAGITLIIAGIIPAQVAIYWLDPQTGSSQRTTLSGGELQLIYTFSKG